MKNFTMYIVIIALCAILIVAGVVVWINLANEGLIGTVSSSSTPNIPTSSQLETPSDPISSLIPSTSTSSVITSSELANLSGVPDGVTIIPQDDPRTEFGPGPDSANDDVKRCYLTFDDGPSSSNTTKILDILDQYNVKATFFVIGTGNLDVMKQAYDRGHAIGLHANSHTYSKIYTSTDAYFADLETLGYKVKQYIGFTPNIIRFPGGSSNTVSRGYCKGIMSTLSQEVETRGYYYFDWNVDSTDASGNNIPAADIVANIKKYVGGKNICVLMHDTAAKKTTVEALPQIIEYIRGKGYEFCVLNKYAHEFHHGINN